MPSIDGDTGERYDMPEYTHIVGPGLGVEVILEEGASLDCSGERTLRDPLHRLVSAGEKENATITMGLVEEEDA